MDLSILVTIVLGFATCVSPFLVSLVNNYHARKLRRIELAEERTIRKLELNTELKKQFVSEEYSCKRNMYTNFINVAVQYMSDYHNPEIYTKMLSAYSECVMCGINSAHLDVYMQYVKRSEENFDLDEHSLKQMSLALKIITNDFRDNLKVISSNDEHDKSSK